MRLLLLSCLAVAAVPSTRGQSTFGACSTNDYYSSLSNQVGSWKKSEVTSLLKSTHRRVLNFTNADNPGENDVWAAIIDLDEGTNQPGTVRLVYSQEEIPALPFGQLGWIKDHLWPILRGPSIFGPDSTDVHNIRPSDPVADLVRGTKYFGECGVLVREDTCQAPAEGGADDTCVCNRVYTPPEAAKGEIARALMYMDVRYDGSEIFTRNLRLVDCPFQPERDMAYLSQMLTWHQEYPPSQAEILRNDKACGSWQGNRNPFVDFPDLAEQFYGTPLPLPAVGERLIYEECEAIPTLAPTGTANDCDILEPGDIQIWLQNSQDPDGLGLYTFTEIAPEFELFITDNPWDGEKFLESEGTIMFKAPKNGLPGGAVWGFGIDGVDLAENFERVQGEFSISTAGEATFLYCYDSSGNQRPLLLFNNGGILAAEGLESYAENESALPQNLGEAGIVNLPHEDNYVYDGPENLSDEELKKMVRDPLNWNGSSLGRHGILQSASNGSSAGSSKFSLSGWVGMLLAAALPLAASG